MHTRRLSIAMVSTKEIKVLRKADKIRNVQEVKKVLSRCVTEMKTPKMMHFIIEFDESKLPSKIIQKIKESYQSEFIKFERERLVRLETKQEVKRSKDYRVRKRKPFDLEMIYSLEAKMLKLKDINSKPYQYNHIHFMFIADFGDNRFNYKEVITILNRTLSRLPFTVPINVIDDFNYIGFYGYNKCGYLRCRDSRSTNQASDADFTELRGHDLKSEFKDAIIRASYLCKSEQKNLLPDELKRYSFGHTRPSRACNDRIYEKVA